MRPTHNRTKRPARNLRIPAKPVAKVDWCGPTVRHQLIETGRVNRGITNSARVKKGIRKILTGTSVPLDVPANGRPAGTVTVARRDSKNCKVVSFLFS